jgi:hypothetical protein
MITGLIILGLAVGGFLMGYYVGGKIADSIFKEGMKASNAITGSVVRVVAGVTVAAVGAGVGYNAGSAMLPPPTATVVGVLSERGNTSVTGSTPDATDIFVTLTSTPMPTFTPLPTSTSTPVPSTMTPSPPPAPTSTPVPTNTPAPEPTPTDTPVPAPSYTPILPTLTPIPQSYCASWNPKGIYIQTPGSDEETYICSKGTNPVWSPDGSQIAFACPAKNLCGWEVCLINRDGTGMRQVTTDTDYSGEPHWLPDGQGLLVASYREKSTDIWQINLNDNTWINLTPNTPGSHEHSPKFMEGYNQIIFNSDRERDHYLDLPGIAWYIASQDGSAVRFLIGSAVVVDQTCFPWRTRICSQ